MRGWIPSGRESPESCATTSFQSFHPIIGPWWLPGGCANWNKISEQVMKRFDEKCNRFIHILHFLQDGPVYAKKGREVGIATVTLTSSGGCGGSILSNASGASLTEQ